MFNRNSSSVHSAINVTFVSDVCSGIEDDAGSNTFFSNPGNDMNDDLSCSPLGVEEVKRQASSRDVMQLAERKVDHKTHNAVKQKVRCLEFV